MLICQREFLSISCAQSLRTAAHSSLQITDLRSGELYQLAIRLTTLDRNTFMPQSLQEYHARWQQAMQQWNLSEKVEDPELTEESCVIFATANPSPMRERMRALPDSGAAICYYRYYRLPTELEPPEPQ